MRLGLRIQDTVSGEALEWSRILLKTTGVVKTARSVEGRTCEDDNMPDAEG